MGKKGRRGRKKKKGEPPIQQSDLTFQYSLHAPPHRRGHRHSETGPALQYYTAYPYQKDTLRSALRMYTTQRVPVDVSTFPATLSAPAALLACPPVLIIPITYPSPPLSCPF